jgi:hypothetical protein
MDISGTWIRAVVIGFALTLGACGSGADGSAQTQEPATGIGLAGGTVVGSSGAKVRIPPAALTTNTDVAITQTSADAPPLPAGTRRIGETFAFTPHGTTFAVPVTVTLPFDPAAVSRGSSPTLMKTNEQDQFETVGNAIFGATAVTAQVTSFSSFVIVENLNDRQVSDWSFEEQRIIGGDPQFIETQRLVSLGRELNGLRSLGAANLDSVLVRSDDELVPHDQQ